MLADHRVLVGMHGERLVVEDLCQSPVRLVLDAHPPLFLHDLALALERLFVHAQRRHAIGFEPQHQRQVLLRRGLPEHRRILSRVGVALPADARDEGGVRFRLDVLRALEHQVLEQVCEAGAAGPLVLRSDVIPELQVDDRRGVIFRQHDGEAVVERRDAIFELGRTDGRGCRRDCQRAHHDGQSTRHETPPQARAPVQRTH